MSAYGSSKIKEAFHQKDEGFNFIKQKKGELEVDARKYIRSHELNLLLCNETCVIQFIYLLVTYAPLFTTMDFDDKTGKEGVRALSNFEVLSRACGIKFPEKRPSNQLYRSFWELRNAQYIKNRPIVFFPECTKTNGKGIIKIPEPAMKLIAGAVTDTFKIHSLSF